NLVKERDGLKQGVTAFEERVDQYYKDTDAKLKETQNRLTAAEAERSKYREAILSAHRQGLLDVAKDLGFTEEELKNTAPPTRQEAHDEAIRKAEREKVSQEYAAKYAGHPELRPLEESRSPFAPRPSTDTRSGKQPWEVGTPEQLHDTRVRRGTELALTRNRP